MTKYSEKIVNAYNKWMRVIEQQPNHEYDPKYKSWKRKDKKAGNYFENACKKEGLNYIKVSSELMPTTFYVN